MPNYYPVFVGEENLRHNVDVYALNYHPVFGEEDDNEDVILSRLVHLILRNPKNLLAHVQRIHFCYQKSKEIQLYAALLDLFVVLDGKATALANKMLYATRSVLAEEDFVGLKAYLQSGKMETIRDNCFAVIPAFSPAASVLIHKEIPQGEIKHDFLQLAHSYIEYSQLEEAIGVLEQALDDEPSNIEVQQLLLQLYRSTSNVIRFKTKFSESVANNLELIPEWQELDMFFEEQKL